MDAVVLSTQAMQVFVSGDDEIGAGGKRAGDDGIVIRIVGHDTTDVIGPDQIRQHAVPLHQKSRVGLPRGEHRHPFLAREHVCQFVEQRAAGVEGDSPFFRQIEQMAGPSAPPTSRAISCTAAQSPSDAAGNPASITSTRRRAN